MLNPIILKIGILPKAVLVTLILCAGQDILVITARADRGHNKKRRQESCSLHKVFFAMPLI